jgi:hypothetical protein
MMMKSNKIKIINHFNDASLIFGKSVDITGGVSYFLYDNSYDGICLLNADVIDMKKYDIILVINLVKDIKYGFRKYNLIIVKIEHRFGRQYEIF